MTRGVVAAALSLGLHLVGAAALLVRREPTPSPVVQKPVAIEVMRLAAVMGPRPKPVVAASAAPAPHRSPRAQPPRAEPAPAAEPAAPEPSREEASPALAPYDAPAETPAAPVVAAAAPPDTTALSRRLQEVATRCYPAAARRFRQTGEAEVKFCLDGAGALASAEVSRSSGSELLDHAASGCVVPGAAPFGDEARGRCFTLPVRFRP